MNYHILDGEEDARTYRVVFHIPVPDEANVAGVNLRVALAEDVSVDKTSIVPAARLGVGEQNDLDTGALFELHVAYTRKQGNTQVQDRDALDAKYTTMVPMIQNQLRDEYKYWGFSRDVP
jgi:hypothetical protein